MKIKRTAWAALVAAGALAGASGSAIAHSPGTYGMQMGPGMMRGGGMGPGMMRGGMMMHPMMMRRMMMMRGMMGHGFGPGLIYGMGPGAGQDLTVDDVKKYLTRVLKRHGNKRLKLGKVTQTDKNTIVAEIVTVDNSLVQKLAFDRHDRIIRQVN